ncbi:MAG: Coenzyme F420 hydrogenase/dehydrogenase, beta subunit C-terminal domain [Candidatus Asgardarchaeia archaeon]
MKNYFNLKEEIINTNLCVHCGNCVLACHNNFLTFDKNYNITLSSDLSESEIYEACSNCDLCYNVCPQTGIISLDNLEKEFFGKNSTAIYGHVISAYAARTLYNELLEHSQSGGVATALLWYMIDNNIVDAAIVAKTDSHNPLLARPTVAKTFYDLIDSQGTKFMLIPMTYAIKVALDMGYKKLAILAPPCQLKAIQYLTLSKDEILTSLINHLVLRIGLFCLGTFPPEFLKDLLKREFNIDDYEIDKLNMTDDGLSISLLGGRSKKIPFNIISKKFNKACGYCTDFTGILSDISIGEIGSPRDWSTVLIRTRRGYNIFSGAVKQGLLEAYELDKSSILGIERLSQEKVRRGFVSEFDKISYGIKTTDYTDYSIPIMALFIVLNSGEAIYTRVYDKTLKESMSRGRSDLFTGAVTAISLALKETVKSKKYLEKIDFGDIKILVSFKKQFYVAVISEYDSIKLREKLDEFADEFEKRFFSESSFVNRELEKYDEADTLVEKFFNIKRFL